MDEPIIPPPMTAMSYLISLLWFRPKHATIVAHRQLRRIARLPVTGGPYVRAPILNQRQGCTSAEVGVGVDAMGETAGVEVGKGLTSGVASGAQFVSHAGAASSTTPITAVFASMLLPDKNVGWAISFTTGG